MARALIVGCGCRGRALGVQLLERGWAVRGTSRSEAGLAEIGEAGIEAVQADPDRVGTVLEQVDGVTVVLWLLASAEGGEGAVAALHGPRLERMLEKLVDSPVRGFVYEAAGTAGAPNLAEGARLVREAGERWRIPARIVDSDPRAHEEWAEAMIAAVEGLIAG